MFQQKTKEAEQKDKSCHYCAKNLKLVDYQDVETLKHFVSSYMKIAPKKRSGLCSNHQKKVAKAIKHARVAGLMSFLPR